MSNKNIFFASFFLLLNFQLPVFALIDPTRAPDAEDGSIPIEGVIVKKDSKVVFLSGQLVTEGDKTLYGETKRITVDDVSFAEDSKLMTQSLVTHFKKDKTD